MKLSCNCCDGIYNSFDVHFTSACDNMCKHCIDSRYAGTGMVKPDIEKISATVLENKYRLDDVLFLGGEPCLFLKELVECVKIIKNNSNLKVYVTTSVPRVCFDNRDLFIELISILDGINLSVQHHNENIADEIRQTNSMYDRQKFYNDLPFKEKIRINLNIVKPFLYKKEDVMECLIHYDIMGFNSIKLSEIQHGTDVFVSFETLFDMRFGSPYSDGCQKYIELPQIKTPVLLKRSCFICEDTLKATFLDGLKVLSKFFIRPKNKYGVIYEDGKLMKGWV